MFLSWIVTQPELICSKLTMKTPEQCVKPVNRKNTDVIGVVLVSSFLTLNNFTHCSGPSTAPVDFEKVKAGWVTIYVYQEVREKSSACLSLLTLSVPCISKSCIEIKVKLNFHTFCGASKDFMKAIKTFIKPFEAPQRSVKTKFNLIFFYSSGTGTGRVNKPQKAFT